MNTDKQYRENRPKTIPAHVAGFFIERGRQAMKPTAEEILQYQISKRPSIWAQYYTRLRGKDYRFEQLMPNGELDLRRPNQIPAGDRNIGLRGQRQFLQQTLDDQHPHKTMQKSRQ